MRKKRLYLVQVNNRYGENVYLPYSVGLLWAYARTFPEITNAYDFCGFLYLKEPIDKAIAKIDSPDLIGLSNYIWNENWNRELGKEIKRKWPDCQIIAGGPSVWDESIKTLKENFWLDFAIYGEGEGAFASFLIENSKEVPNFCNVGSLLWKSYCGAMNKFGEVFPLDLCGYVVNKRIGFTDLSKLRNPYLDGVFEDILPHESRWQVLQETARGCPFFCSFCEWGQAALNKIRQFPMDRVMAEMEWIGQHKVDYVDNCDANFGILARDEQIADALITTKAKYGQPEKFRTSYAKYSNQQISDRIFRIANKLNQSGQIKAVTLALQSTDGDTLDIINRKNIAMGNFGSLVKKYEENGIPTYTELIMGLPDESLNSYMEGIEKCLEAGQHRGLFMYCNLMLPNTEQNTPEYKERHGIKTRQMKAMLTHGVPEPDTIGETQEIVIETKAMPFEDWKKAWLYSKTIEIFHVQGLLREMAIASHSCGRMSYKDFYSDLIDWMGRNPNTVAGSEYKGLVDLLDRVLNGGSWDCVDTRLGNISWPPEEFAFARICLQLDRFYDEYERSGCYFDYSYKSKQRGDIVGPTLGHEEEWAREAVWYCRKGTQGRRKELTNA